MSTNSTIISEPVSFDGEKLVTGDVKLFVERCKVEGVAFSFSPQYGLLLLKNETKTEAQKLLKAFTEVPLLSDNAQNDLIHQVCTNGFKWAWLEFERYKQSVPTKGEPKFYAESGYGKSVNERIISLVSAEKALRFYASEDMSPVVKQLPLNVYKSSMVHTSFSLTLERYRGVLGREKDFFAFVEELYRYVGYLRGDTCNECYRRYFEDTAGAYELLKIIRSKVSGRERRDQLFQTLERDKVLEFSEGLFTYVGWSAFFVSNNGDVQRLCYKKQVDAREAILRAYVKGKLPTKLEEEKEPNTLKRIAEIVGKVRPELTLLILA